ncbi:MAG TPA: phosphate acyltransferase PlsX [Alphaproteobacteria bacterium]|nr:phosphate acyltransferase PlsX [Rhodospirillaceae bacterium]HRJ12125.1 phosphate acyltransferase PlsX [Alphaproteobacteria bacterium]
MTNDSAGVIRIALDAMGGDHAPKIVVEGAAIAQTRYPNVQFTFFGNEAELTLLLAKQKDLKNNYSIVHTSERVLADDKVAHALRNGRNSSMRLAINAVHEGKAEAVVSAGNTGALMAMAKFVLKTLPNIDRPAICAFFPTLKGETVMLDLGANVECTPENLVDFAVMGAIFATTVLGVHRPRIGILNVGSEEMKGRDDVRVAAQELRALQLPGEFIGYVEGDDITRGSVDVVVTDGFTGNVALKTAEGTAKMYSEFLKRTFKSSWLAQIGYLFARTAFKKLRKRTDPRTYNGALFVGLRGVCVKSHGGTDEIGFANAIGVAHDLVKYKFNDEISSRVELIHEKVLALPPEVKIPAAEPVAV